MITTSPEIHAKDVSVAEQTARGLGYNSLASLKQSLSDRRGAGLKGRLESGEGVLAAVSGTALDQIKTTVNKASPKKIAKTFYNSFFSGSDIFSSYMRGRLNNLSKTNQNKKDKDSEEILATKVDNNSNNGLSDESNNFLKIIAKNSIYISKIAKDINIFKQNIGKLLDLENSKVSFAEKENKVNEPEKYLLREEEAEKKTEEARDNEKENKASNSPTPVKKSGGIISSIIKSLMVAIPLMLVTAGIMGAEEGSFLGKVKEDVKKIFETLIKPEVFWEYIKKLFKKIKSWIFGEKGKPGILGVISSSLGKNLDKKLEDQRKAIDENEKKGEGPKPLSEILDEKLKIQGENIEKNGSPDYISKTKNFLENPIFPDDLDAPKRYKELKEKREKAESKMSLGQIIKNRITLEPLPEDDGKTAINKDSSPKPPAILHPGRWKEKVEHDREPKVTPATPEEPKVTPATPEEPKKSDSLIIKAIKKFAGAEETPGEPIPEKVDKTPTIIKKDEGSKKKTSIEYDKPTTPKIYPIEPKTQGKQLNTISTMVSESQRVESSNDKIAVIDKSSSNKNKSVSRSKIDNHINVYDEEFIKYFATA